MFVPNAIYYEKNITDYPLGRTLLDQYASIPKIIIDSHNNIPEMRKNQNSEFPKMKRNLIIGVRKTHQFVPNHKVSDFLVPYTSSGCTAMCLYCYLVCNYNKCSYLRLFVNREQMLNKIIKTANDSEKELTFEIGSNSDLILENSITHNLEWTIKHFSDAKKGFLTFPTKFDMVDPILNVPGKERIIVRMSMNPNDIIQKVEFGTSPLQARITALNKLKSAGFPVGILIAPIILVDNWKELYENFLIELSCKLSEEVKKEVFFELIFMTYSYVHTKINEEAFPNALSLYEKDLMTGTGRGKYHYRPNIKDEASSYLLSLMKKYFPNNHILYIV
ncbi:MAG: spore photoproduct lyase [Clostridia bacterium]|nr:spore photoproduct lyase [Clostridia bacterium]